LYLWIFYVGRVQSHTISLEVQMKKNLLLLLIVSALLCTTAFGQTYEVPPAGKYVNSSVEMAPQVKPEIPMDWPWAGFYPLAIVAPTGLAYDGQYFWIPDWAAGSRPCYLYKVNTSTGVIEGTIPAPSLWPGGITFDGSHLWVTDYISGAQIFKVDPATGTVIASYPINYSSFWAGVAWDGQYLYYGITAGTIYQIDPATGVQMNSWPVPGGEISGLTYHDGYFYYSDSYNYMLHKMDTNFNIVESSPAYVQSWLGGVEVAEGYLWNVDYSNDDLHYYELANPNVIIDLTYVSGSPVPAGGGNLVFDVFVENASGSAQDFDAWLESAYEGGIPTTLVLRSFTNYMSGWTINRPGMFYPISGTWSAGNYTFTGKVGINPATAWDESGFPFVKSGADAIPGFKPFPVDGAPNPFDIIETEQLQTTSYKLLTNYPNPFNPSTLIRYSLEAATNVELAVYDISGREVARLINGYRSAGSHEVSFDASHLGSGIYLARFTAGDFTQTQKLVLVK